MTNAEIGKRKSERGATASPVCRAVRGMVAIFLTSQFLILTSVAQVRDVIVDETGKVVAPVNLWEANKADIAEAVALDFAPTWRTVTAGTGLSGGGDLTANRTISLADTAVTAGTYGSANKSVTLTVDAQGRITSAANATITPTGIGALRYDSGQGSLWGWSRTKIGNGQLPMPFYSARNWFQIENNDNPSFALTNTSTGWGVTVTAVNSTGHIGFPGGNGTGALMALYSTADTYVPNFIHLTPTATRIGQPLVVPGASFTGAVTYADAGQAHKAMAPYASFDIKLGAGFTDFELKATVDNFTDDPVNMVFFYHSPDPNESVVPQVWTTRPDVYFTDSQFVGSPPSRNQRYWRKQSASQSIAAMRTNGNSVIASVTVVVRDMGTISPANPNLVWSYARMTPTGYEEDAGGKSIWHTITPKWISQPIAP